MSSQNPGIVFEEFLLEQNITIKKMQHILGHQNIQSIQRRIINFKNYKGWIKTYVNYFNAVGFHVKFKIKKKDTEYVSDNIGELLETVREEYYLHLTKDDFANDILDLGNYTYTLNSFLYNNCSFEKIYLIFVEKLGYDIKYIIENE